MLPADFRRWRRILVWSILTGGTVWLLNLVYLWKPELFSSIYSAIGL
jgi:hypothetical protein